MTEIQNPSLPKDMIKVLLLEGISDTAVETFKTAGYNNIERLSTALGGDELIEKLKDTRIPVSYTHLTLPTTPYV